MNWDRIEGNWKQLTGKVQQQWGELTNDDLDVVAGNREMLAGRIQERYGISRDEAEDQINNWESGYNDSWLAAPVAAGSSRMVTGVFRDRESAEAAYAEATRRGYSNKDIDLVMSEDTRKRHFADGSGIETELGNKAAEGAGIGAGIGGTIGAITAALAAVGTSLALPGLGLVVAGPLAAAAAGAGVGAASGGLIGALVGWNMPEERVKEYEDSVREGGILMGVRTRDEADAAGLHDHWTNSRGEKVYM